MMHQYGMNYWHMGWGWIFQLIIVILFFLVIWWMMRAGGNFGYRTTESAMDILRKRYASGEIDKKEYEAMKKELGNGDRH